VTILELVEWHESKARTATNHANDVGVHQDTMNDLLADAARHRATAAALRAKYAMDCAMASGTLAWVRDTRALISDPAVMAAIENTNKADDECNRLLQEIK